MSPLLAQGAAAVLVVVALVVGRRALRLRSRGGAAAPVQVRDRCPLARESGLALVDWNGRELLVGYGPGGVTVLCDAGREVRS